MILHRVPPEIRILTPGRRFFSSKITRAPHSAARAAATRSRSPSTQDDDVIVEHANPICRTPPLAACHTARGRLVTPFVGWVKPSARGFMPVGRSPRLMTLSLPCELSTDFASDALPWA